MNTLEVNETQTEEHSFFTSKEHYLAFRDAWKQYHADGKHKKETYTDYQGGICKCPSELTSDHHLVYNALRKRDLSKSFTPITSEGKLNAFNGKPYAAFYAAKGRISACIKYNRTDWLKEPFGGTVTDDMLKELNEALESINL
jgi:hypothetical protein